MKKKDIVERNGIKQQQQQHYCKVLLVSCWYSNLYNTVWGFFSFLYSFFVYCSYCYYDSIVVLMWARFVCVKNIILSIVDACHSVVSNANQNWFVCRSVDSFFNGNWKSNLLGSQWRRSINHRHSKNLDVKLLIIIHRTWPNIFYPYHKVSTRKNSRGRIVRNMFKNFSK